MTRRLRDWWHRNKHPLQDLLTINHCDCFVFCRCMATLRFITIPWRTLKLRSTLNVRPYQQRGKSNVTECVSNTISIITNPFTNHQLTNSLAKLDGDQTLIVCVILFLFLFVRVCVCETCQTFQLDDSMTIMWALRRFKFERNFCSFLFQAQNKSRKAMNISLKKFRSSRSIPCDTKPQRFTSRWWWYTNTVINVVLKTFKSSGKALAHFVFF